jgi:large subunit ribosomal protein L6
MPVVVPSGVQVNIQGSSVKVKGPKGELERTFSPLIGINMEAGNIIVQRSSDAPQQRALHGTTRALISNMVTGVSTGFTKTLEVDGVGYRAEMNGNNLVLYVGYSHPVVVEPPQGISFEVETRTRQVNVKGYDFEQIGQVAANIREIRPPEPYKGKGIRYKGEHIRRKAGKSGKAKK